MFSLPRSVFLMFFLELDPPRASPPVFCSCGCMIPRPSCKNCNITFRFQKRRGMDGIFSPSSLLFFPFSSPLVIFPCDYAPGSLYREVLKCTLFSPASPPPLFSTVFSCPHVFQVATTQPTRTFCPLLDSGWWPLDHPLLHLRCFPFESFLNFLPAFFFFFFFGFFDLLCPPGPSVPPPPQGRGGNGSRAISLFLKRAKRVFPPCFPPSPPCSFFYGTRQRLKTIQFSALTRVSFWGLDPS